MTTFADICTSLGVGAAAANNNIGGPLQLTANYNAGGGGYQPSVVIDSNLQTTMHVTIYRDSWNGQGVVAQYGQAPLGPHGLHLTYTDQQTGNVRHVFYKYENGFLWCLTDGETPREKLTMQTLMQTLGSHLS
jgi:hypothetical protein